MKVYFEGTKYHNSQVDRRVLKLFSETKNKGFLQPSFVGYFSDHIKQPVVFLPKIAIDLIGNSEASIIELATAGLTDRKCKDKTINYEFISKFIYIFYLSLIKFCDRKPETIISLSGRLFEINVKRSSFKTTELETVIALLDFYKSHKELINFVAKQELSSSSSSIDWNRTVRSTLPFVSGKNVIYTQTISNYEEQNFLDDLLTVFHSLLSFLNKTYGVKVKPNEFYVNVSYRSINNFNKKCRKILKKIKGSHFDDRYVKLHKLLTAYFEIHSNNTKAKSSEDKLLIRDYNIVFEDMVDLLLSDQEVIGDLKNQRDGKIVDHLYRYDSLFSGEDIYYIGDSKYYKDTTSFSDLAKYKQFTYAKNVIQFNVDPFGEKEQLTYRDETTEGYNLTPSFFINGFLKDENLNSPNHGFESEEFRDKTAFLCQFENRVFDRDSLYLCYFKMNFLFILKSYVTENRYTLLKLRDEVYTTIRTHFISLYNSNYDFYKLSPNVPLHDFIEKNFRAIHGKVFQCGQDKLEGTITLGLDSSDKYDVENNRLLNNLSNQCKLRKYVFT